MRLVKIGIASVNATVGAVRSNVDRCVRLAHEMAEEGTTIALFPPPPASSLAGHESSL